MAIVYFDKRVSEDWEIPHHRLLGTPVRPFTAGGTLQSSEDWGASSSKVSPLRGHERSP